MSILTRNVVTASGSHRQPKTVVHCNYYCKRAPSKNGRRKWWTTRRLREETVSIVDASVTGLRKQLLFLRALLVLFLKRQFFSLDEFKYFLLKPGNYVTVVHTFSRKGGSVHVNLHFASNLLFKTCFTEKTLTPRRWIQF